MKAAAFPWSQTSRWSRWSRWLACALLACAGHAHALGADMPYAAYATAPDVDWVKVCGEWPAPVPAGQGMGTYRIVHASRYGQSFLYVQWLQRDATDSAVEVQTLGIDEINNDHADITLSQMQCQATRLGIRLTARAASGHSQGGKAFRITVDAGHRPGDLRYRSTQKR